MDKYTSDILRQIDKSIDDFQENIPEIQKQLFDELQPMIKELLTKDGKLINNIDNLKLIGKIKNQLKKIIQQGAYKRNVEKFIEGFNLMSQLNLLYFRQFDEQYKPTKLLNTIKELAIESTVTDLIGEGMDANVVKPVRDILIQNVTTGGSYADFQNVLRDHIIGDKETVGRLERYTKQITTDAINQFNAQYHNTIAQDLNFSWGQYLGSNITTSREFCVLLTQKRYVHKSELPTIIQGDIDGHQCRISKTTGLPLGMIPDTNDANFKIRRGGYNCRHQFFWVPNSVIPKELRDKFKK